MPILTGSCGNRFAICQIIYKNTNRGTVTLSEQDELAVNAMALEIIFGFSDFGKISKAKLHEQQFHMVPLNSSISQYF